MSYQADYFEKNINSRLKVYADENHYAFNEFIRILVEQGHLGFLLFLLLIASSLLPVYESEQKIFNPIKLLMLSLLIFGFFSYPFSFFEYQLLLITFISIISKSKSPIFEIKLNRSYNFLRYSHLIYLSVFIIYFFLILSFFGKKINTHFHEFSQWKDSLHDYKSHDSITLSKFEIYYSTLGENPDFLYSYGKILNLEGRFTEAIPILMQADYQRSSYYTLIELGKSFEGADDFNGAEVCWNQASFMIPSRLKPKFLIAGLYCKRGDSITASKMIDHLKNTEPKIYTPEYYKMLTDIDSLCLGSK